MGATLGFRRGVIRLIIDSYPKIRASTWIHGNWKHVNLLHPHAPAVMDTAILGHDMMSMVSLSLASTLARDDKAWIKCTVFRIIHQTRCFRR